MMPKEELSPLDRHLAGVAAALLPYRAVAGRLTRWGGQLAWTLGQGGRLLVAGNGGSAAEAQHLAAELVGRLRDERTPLSAVALTADSSAVTAISNDYGYEQVFARQVRAHGRPDDILVVLSTSGRSANLLTAVEVAREIGMRTWAFTGPGPNPLADLCDEALCCPADDSQVVQELHLISVHLLCEYVDRTLPAVLGTPSGRAHRDVTTALASGHLITTGAQHTNGIIHPAAAVHPAAKGNGHGNGNGNGRSHEDGARA
jgi:D-sedoheptulose 7-phosphate isomerase